MQTLLLAEHFIGPTINGSKFQTIRDGHRDYKTGKVLFTCPKIGWSLIKEITEVIHTTVRNCSEEHYHNEGWTSHADMIVCLRRYYPNINMDTDITIIKFK